MSRLRELAGWVADFSGPIPASRRRLLALQGAAVVASTLAGARSPQGAPLRRLLGDGELAVLPGEPPSPLEAWLGVLPGLTAAGGIDDWLLGGRAGRYTVWAAWLGAARLGLGWDAALRAQLIGNELLGRLGGACLGALQRGERSGLAPAVASAAVFAHLEGLGPEGITAAMALAAQGASPPQRRDAAFELAAAGQDVLGGQRAASLAAAGLPAPLGVLDRGAELWRNHAADHPVLAWLSGLGAAWITDSLVLGPSPGSPLLATASEGLADVLDAHAAEHGQRPAPDDVQRVELDATLPVHEALRRGGRMRVAGWPDVEVPGLHVHHDWSLSLDAWEDLSTGLGMHRLVAALGPAGVLGVLARRALPRARDLGGDLLDDPTASLHRVAGWAGVGLGRLVGGAASGSLRRVVSGDDGYDLGDFDLAAFVVPNPVRITMLLQDGRVLHGERRYARGQPGVVTEDERAAALRALVERVAGNSAPTLLSLFDEPAPGSGPADLLEELARA